MKVIADNAIKPRNAGFAQNLMHKEVLVYDVRAMVKGEQRYFIIKLIPAKQAAFLRAVEKDAGLRLEDYGDILYRGWDEPEDDLKALLQTQYGMVYTESKAETES